MTESDTAAAGGATVEYLTGQRIVVLDFGSQYAQLIARRVREQNVYCQIVRHDITAERLAELAPKGIILSGGPSSVYAANAPKCDPELFRVGHSGPWDLLWHAADLRSARRQGRQHHHARVRAGEVSDQQARLAVRRNA